MAERRMSDLTQNKNEKVSIILPFFNGARYIEETIDSVRRQTRKDWELIAIDDGSTDASAEIVERYCRMDRRIRLIREGHAGSSAARNRGIEEAEGRYIVLLDADDLWAPEFLEKQLAFLKEKKAICVCSSYGLIDADSRDIRRPVIAKPVITTADMMVTNYVGCMTGVYDREKYGKVYLDPYLNSLRDDYAYWLKICRMEGKIFGNPEVLAKHRVYGESTTGNKLRLVRVQYRFYRDYLKLGIGKSIMNTIVWGTWGVRKYLIGRNRRADQSRVNSDA